MCYVGPESPIARGCTTSAMSTPTSVLTTIFTGPTTCLPAAWSTFNSCGKGGVEDGTLLCAPVLRSDCFPGHTSLDDYELTTLWSPGVCPSGWYAASSSAADTAEDVTSYCCPSYVQGPVPARMDRVLTVIVV